MNKDTKILLLKVTRNLIDKVGMEAVTLRNVGIHAGLSRSAVYRHFQDKESLLSEITIEDFILLLKLFDKISEINTTPKDILKDLLIQFHAYGINHKEHYKLMFGTEWNKKKFPQLHLYARNLFSKILEMVDLVLEKEGIKSKSALQCTAVLFAFIHGLIELHLIGHFESAKGLDKADQLINHILTLMTNQ